MCERTCTSGFYYYEIKCLYDWYNEKTEHAIKNLLTQVKEKLIPDIFTAIYS